MIQENQQNQFKVNLTSKELHLEPVMDIQIYTN